MGRSAEDARGTIVLDEVMPRWDFRERHSTSIGAAPRAVYDAMWTVTAGELAPAYRLLFEARYLPERLMGRKKEMFNPDAPMMDQIAAGRPLPLVRLGTVEEREVVFGGIVPADIIRVWNEEAGRHILIRDRRQFEAFDDADCMKVAAHFLLVPEGGRTDLRAETRVAALSPRGRLMFAPYWFAIRIGGGIVRRVWLNGIKRRAEVPGPAKGRVR